MKGNQQKSPLTRNQEAALVAILAQPTLALAAAQAKVSLATLYRWMYRDEAFRAEYLRLRKEIVGNAALQLQKANTNAVNALVSVLNYPEAPASARVAAARTVLEMSLKALEAESIEERIAALEAAYAQQNAMTNGHTRRWAYWGGRTVSFEKRLRALERITAFRAAMTPPDFDAKAEVIKRINRMAERIEYWGDTPPVDKGDPQQWVEYFREWVRSKYGE
jgi:hypothetical protein